MKTLLLLVLALPALCYAQFRDTKWGLPKGVVRQSEGYKQPELTKVDDTELLIYFGEKLGIYDVTLFYAFDDDRLTGGGYFIDEEYVNENNYIELFNDLLDNISAKYGSPQSSDHMVWNGSTYKNNPDRYGFAVASGELEYKANWLIDNRTFIILSLTGENYKIQASIHYSDNTFMRERNIEPYDGI